MLDNSGLDIEKVVGNLNDIEFMNRAMSDIDVVLHIAGIQKSLNFVNTAIFNNVKRGILVHTTGIFSKFKSASEDYLQIENEIDSIIRSKNNNMKITILRPTMIYGDLCDLNMSKFIKMVDYLRLFPIINKGKSLIQPVNTQDLGKTYYQILTTPQEKFKPEYVVSGDVPITMIEAFRTISNKLGKKTLFISFPLWFGVL